MNFDIAQGEPLTEGSRRGACDARSTLGSIVPKRGEPNLSSNNRAGQNLDLPGSQALSCDHQQCRAGGNHGVKVCIIGRSNNSILFAPPFRHDPTRTDQTTNLSIPQRQTKEKLEHTNSAQVAPPDPESRPTLYSNITRPFV